MDNIAPVSYRIQLRDGIDFNYVIEVIPYLKKLGITHLYLSPIFKAPEHSTHGYDIADPTEICPTLGGMEGLQKTLECLEQHQMLLILDIVPNHMSADPKYNRWWWDVLEKGSWSFYEEFFDIYWAELSQTPYRDKIVLPILGEPLEQIISSRQLQINYDEESFHLSYYDHKVPINLQGISVLTQSLTPSDDLLEVRKSLKRLRPQTLNRFFVSKESFHDYHKKVYSEINAYCQANSEKVKSWLAACNQPENYDELIRQILDQQFYKLVWWRNGRYLINYRRFFTINDLIAVKEERQDVFLKSHSLIMDLCRSKTVDGLRVDHPDGLNQPGRYFKNLRKFFPSKLILAEKILEASEELPDWPIDGTTGYDFLADLTALFLTADFASRFTQFYEEFIGERDNYQKMVKVQKSKLLEGDLYADFQRVVRLFYDLVYTNRSTTDHSVRDCEIFLEHLITSLEVYRTYITLSQKSNNDQQGIKYWKSAIASFIEEKSSLLPLSKYFLTIILDKFRSPAEQTFLDYLQKLTSPVTAKAVEDHVFYSYNRMVVLNEVGSDPMRFGISLDEFHARQVKRAKKWPKSMLASSTHDTKRSEDVRARLCVISEMPDRWFQQVTEWHQFKLKFDPDQNVDPRTEYFLFQNLLGSWPISQERFQEFMIKSAREADHHTSWRSPQEEYEKNLSRLVTRLFQDADFTKSLDDFVNSIEAFANINSLSQTLVKLTSPGIADIYQGCETYQYTLVDPDNRRRIDHLGLQDLLVAAQQTEISVIASDWKQPIAKLWLHALILKARQEHPADFAPGSEYHPLILAGTPNPAIFAYTRGQNICVVASRFPYRYQNPAADTLIQLPSPGSWHDLINNQKIEGASIELSKVWQYFPGSLFVKL